VDLSGEAPLIMAAAALVGVFINAFLTMRLFRRTQPQTEAVATQQAVTGMNTEIGKLRTSLTEEVAGLRTATTSEFSGVRSLLDAMRTENTQQRTEFRADVADVRRDLSLLRSDVSAVRGELAEMNHGLRDDVTRLRDSIEKAGHPA
jgi:hypothetical protein